MRIWKRILAAVLVMMLSYQIISLADTQATDVQASDTQGSAVESESIRVLTGLGIMDKITDIRVQLVDTIKRKDFAAILANVLSGGNKIDNLPTGKFSDVPKSDAAAGSIEIAASSGILAGDGNGHFYPEKAITYGEVVKCMVQLLGYDKRAEAYGGYPTGYLSTASQLGLLKNAGGSADDFTNLGTVAEILYNALDVPFLTQRSFGTVYDKYYTDNGTTILTKMFSIYKDKGIVEANESTYLDSQNHLPLGKVKINQTVFDVGNTEAKKYLGYSVTYYYKEDTLSGDRTLDCIQIDKKNQVITVDAEDIDNFTVTAGSRDMELSYREDDDAKEETKNISATADVIYNGKVLLSYTNETFMPEAGKIVLLDNNDDGIYDVVFINAYETILVDQVSPAFGWVTDKYRKAEDGSPYQLQIGTQTDIDDKKLVIRKDDQEIKLTDIQEWDVLDVYSSISNGEQSTEIIVTRHSISGAIKEVSEKEIVINDDLYRLSAAYRQYLEDNNKSISIKDNSTFYLNHDNEIAGMQEDVIDGKYAFIRKAALGDGVSQIVSFRLLNLATGQWMTLKCAEKVHLGDEGAQCTTAYLITLERSLIRYKLNSDGDIDQIYIPASAFTAPKELQRCASQNSLIDGTNGGEYTYYLIKNVTKSLTIPADEENYGEEDMYRMSISLSDTHKYYLMCYDVKNYQVPVVIYETSGSSASVGIEKPTIVVTKITEALDKDGDKVGKITGIQDGGTKAEQLLTSEATQSDAFKQLCLGDFVRIDVDLLGRGDAVARDYDSLNNKIVQSGNGKRYGSSFTDLMLACGTVKAVDLSANVVEIDTTADPDSPNSTTVKIPAGIVINHDHGTRFTTGTKGDLKVGQQVAFRGRAGGSKILEIFITGE